MYEYFVFDRYLWGKRIRGVLYTIPYELLFISYSVRYNETLTSCS